MAPNWKRKFETLIQNLGKRTDIALLAAYLFPPASDDTVRAVEAALGFSLSEQVTDWYRSMDGVQIRWISKQNPRFDAARHQFIEGPFDPLLPWNDYLPDDGLVNVLPMTECFLRNWKGFTWFGHERGKARFLGTNYNLRDLRRSLRPFDAFANDDSMTFVTIDKDADPKLVLTEDHFANYAGSKVTDLGSYAEFLIASQGEVHARSRVFGDVFDAASRPSQRFTADAAFWAQHPP